jgi:hypothetical protein
VRAPSKRTRLPASPCLASVDGCRRCAADCGIPTITPAAELDLLIPLTTGVVAALAAFVLTRRVLARRAARRGLTDEAIRAIEERGTVELDDPLDLREVDAEERRFWTEEQWDESEEW